MTRLNPTKYNATSFYPLRDVFLSTILYSNLTNPYTQHRSLAQNNLLKQALKVIDKHDDITTFEGIIDKLDCCKQTFYNLFTYYCY